MVLDGNRTLASILLLSLHTRYGQIIELSLTRSLSNLLPLPPAHISEPIVFTDFRNSKAHNVMSPELDFSFLGTLLHVYYSFLKKKKTNLLRLNLHTLRFTLVSVISLIFGRFTGLATITTFQLLSSSVISVKFLRPFYSHSSLLIQDYH